jgi:hypothetical protein
MKQVPQHVQGQRLNLFHDPQALLDEGTGALFHADLVCLLPLKQVKSLARNVLHWLFHCFMALKESGETAPVWIVGRADPINAGLAKARGRVLATLLGWAAGDRECRPFVRVQADSAPNHLAELLGRNYAMAADRQPYHNRRTGRAAPPRSFLARLDLLCLHP